MSTERPYANTFREISALYFDDPLPAAIGSYENSNKTFDDQIAVARKVQAAVSSRLRFASLEARPDQQLSPEQILKSEETNCYGNAIVTSELLEELGIDHQVAFANRHAFLLLSEPRTGRLFMLDSMRPLRLELPKGVVEGRLPEEWQLGDGPLFCDMKINTSRLLSLVEPPEDRIKVELSPWLGMNMMAREFFRNDYKNDVILPMKVYPSLPGRELLELYYNSIVYTNTSEFDQLSEALDDMADTRPDDGPEDKFQLARLAFRGMCRNDDSEDSED